MAITKNQRTQIKNQLRSRKKTRDFKFPKFPKMIEMELGKSIIKEIKTIDDLVKEILIPELPRISGHKEERFDDVRGQFKNLAGIALVTALLQKIKGRFYGEFLGEDTEPTQNLFTQSIRSAVKPHLEAAAERTETQFTEEFERQTGTKPLGEQLNVNDFISDSLRSNVSLIKTIPQQHFAKLRTDIENAVRKGELSSSLRKKIIETSKASKTRARLIARDQMGKLVGNIEEARQRKVGIKEYIWRTSQDSRVRSLANSNGYSDHKRLEGTIQKWSSPPITVFKGKRAGERHHPMGDISCRCHAQGIYDSITGIDHKDTIKARKVA